MNICVRTHRLVRQNLHCGTRQQATPEARCRRLGITSGRVAVAGVTALHVTTQLHGSIRPTSSVWCVTHSPTVATHCRPLLHVSSIVTHTNSREIY
ncbi:hypothetical protein DPMN_026745 [Dreissena polymorpha]|uniref:Uncharacterized protein n=1 Tax=Dreissena polymorpha TaxID=45954 RepID=A0A9D4RCW3_DREPO|nr:hypothetical protein DPMN_026745 [Dreissena polymorpha]